MREIKFRAWEYDNKTKDWKMNYNPSVEDCECFGEFSMVNLNRALENGGDADYDKNSLYKDSDGNKINKEETKSIFQQFTGLKDKNGKEIYEGDVVKWDYGNFLDRSIPNPRSGVISWSDKKFGWIAGINKNIEFLGDNVEVIGNIYENPDLIKQ